MKYIAIAAIWMGYAAMVASVAYCVENPSDLMFVPIFFGGIFVVISTAIVANTK